MGSLAPPYPTTPLFEVANCLNNPCDFKWKFLATHPAHEGSAGNISDQKRRGNKMREEKWRGHARLQS